MYVRKFEADTLEEALKNIKRELGPDAIVLKTVTNKGLKGAFKKKRIEITAAISEKSYVKKSKVDTILDETQKESFYSSPASYISNMLDTSSTRKETPASAPTSGYGSAGLNRAVRSATSQGGDNGLTSLDDFLKGSAKKEPALSPTPKHVEAPVYEEIPQRHVSTSRPSVDEEIVMEQKARIEQLESKVHELIHGLHKIQDRGPTGIFQLRNSLRSLNISERYVQEVLKKASFELSDDELEDGDIVFEFALRDMLSRIHTSMPLFSTVEEDSSAVTVLVSEVSCGQGSMLLKLGALKKDAVLLTYRPGKSSQNESFTKKFFGIDVVNVGSPAEVVSACRKAIDAGKPIFVDLRVAGQEHGEIKKLIEGLKRSFDKVEVLVTLSALHTELYNGKVVSKYRGTAEGIVVTHLDLCMDFGALFNIAEGAPDMPYKFYGNGDVVPDDLESATAERILAGVFHFE